MNASRADLIDLTNRLKGMAGQARAEARLVDEEQMNASIIRNGAMEASYAYAMAANEVLDLAATQFGELHTAPAAPAVHRFASADEDYDELADEADFKYCVRVPQNGRDFQIRLGNDHVLNAVYGIGENEEPELRLYDDGAHRTVLKALAAAKTVDHVNDQRQRVAQAMNLAAGASWDSMVERANTFRANAVDASEREAQLRHRLKNLEALLATANFDRAALEDRNKKLETQLAQLRVSEASAVSHLMVSQETQREAARRERFQTAASQDAEERAHGHLGADEGNPSGTATGQ